MTATALRRKAALIRPSGTFSRMREKEDTLYHRLAAQGGPHPPFGHLLPQAGEG
ncbi:MAG: hypothetical protein NTU78_16550 [Alphaproteobacteria bacterium]|nr:hypothetical protein [Alphaproteobacteria bacterium]